MKPHRPGLAVSSRVALPAPRPSLSASTIRIMLPPAAPGGLVPGPGPGGHWLLAPGIWRRLRVSLPRFRWATHLYLLAVTVDTVPVALRFLDVPLAAWAHSSDASGRRRMSAGAFRQATRGRGPPEGTRPKPQQAPSADCRGSGDLSALRASALLSRILAMSSALEHRRLKYDTD
jgi:hypothetical protein